MYIMDNVLIADHIVNFMIPYVDSVNGLLAQVTNEFNEDAASPAIWKKVHHIMGSVMK